MTVQDWGAIGEIVGGIAIIATLIYLALQIRQSNTATHRQMYAAGAKEISDYWLTLARDFELHETYLKMLSAPEQLDDTQLERAHLVMDAYMTLMESYYLHNRQYDERLSQERWSRVLARVFAMPGGRVYWRRRRTYFHAEFGEYIDAIAERPPTEGPRQSAPTGIPGTDA